MNKVAALDNAVIMQRRLDTLVRHINNVRENCTLLGERLIERGEIDFARLLMANGFKHDQSKFYGVEWLYLHQEVKDNDPDKFQQAAMNHVTTNKHHPEFWLHINDMPRIYIAELVCDITARSQEFGGAVRDWLEEEGLRKYQITKACKKYREINEFLKILLDEPFKK
jgi:hypothetical protein